MFPFSETPSKAWPVVALGAALCGMAQPMLAQRPVGVDRTRGYGSAVEVAARLDSLEQVAHLASSQPARLAATIRILQIGRVGASTDGSPPQAVYRGVLERLRRIYPSLSSELRGLVVRGLPTMAERSEALVWLRELVNSRDLAGDGFLIAEEAVEALARMGAAGEDELRRLHLSGEADPAMQKMLDVLARTGYRRPPT